MTYGRDDRARDEKEIPMQALLAAALSVAGSPRTPQANVVIGRAEVYAAWLQSKLPPISTAVYLACERRDPHQAHTHYDERDDKVRCAGVE